MCLSACCPKARLTFAAAAAAAAATAAIQTTSAPSIADGHSSCIACQRHHSTLLELPFNVWIYTTLSPEQRFSSAADPAGVAPDPLHA